MINRKKVFNPVLAVLILCSCLFSCREETGASRPNVGKLMFAESKKTLEAGQRASIGISIEPKEAREGNNIEYSASVKGIIEIDQANSGKDGVVFTALKAGTAVIMAKSCGVMDYCDITVTGDTEITIPYISLTENTVEIPVGQKRYVAASLQGGNPSDQNNFVFSNSNDNFLFIESANNTVALEGLKKGVSTITVSHPKAQYNVNVVVFVLNDGETAKYITGDNVVFMELGGSTREYTVRLAGINDENVINQTIYQVIEGASVIEVMGIGSSCTIKAKTGGVAKVKVTNRSINDYQFEFQVVVQQKNELRYIKTKSNFYIINDNDFVNFTVSMEGDVPNDWDAKFQYAVNEQGRDVIYVDYVQGNFIVSGLKNGNAVLIITNEYSGNIPCEILFVVQNKRINVKQDGLYIKTSQTVIQMEAGKNAPDAILKMELVGGTGADQNNFEWVVDDSSVIEVQAPGRVSYKRSQVNTQQSYEVEAVITAKKPGTAKITVYNHSPNCLNDVTVMVKVYPYGTFNGQAVCLGGPGIIRLKEGQDTDVYTPVIGGDVLSLGITVWESMNPDIAEAAGSGLHGNVRALTGASGVTKLKVSGENIAQDFECIIVVYREGEEDTIPYIYTDNISYRLVTGQTARILVRHPNIPQAEFNFTVHNTNKQSIYHAVSGDLIIVSGYEPGTGELVISSDNPDCNDLTVFITVENERIDMTRPYSIKGPDYKGMEEGSVVSLTVEMIGAGANELKNLLWDIEDTNVARIKGYVNNEAQIEGLREGQTVLKVNHSKSVNEKTVIIYVVKKGQSVEGKIVIGIEKQNYVLSNNQSIFLRLLTNASDSEKKLFSIKSITNTQNIHVDFNYDSLVVTGIQEGNSKITVWCYDDNTGIKKNLTDLDIYITVKETAGIHGEIGFPDSVILVKDKYKSVQGSAIGATAGNLYVDYTFEDTSVASVSGNGLDVVLKGLAKGETYLQVSCQQMSFYKKVLVICLADEDELETLYYFTTPKSLYRIKKNDEIKINLGFGENGSPDDAVYEWVNSNNNDAVQIAKQGSGKSAVITGKNQGQALVTISCDTMPEIKKAEIIVEVSDNTTGQDYYRFCLENGIEQMSVGNIKMVPVSIYYGSEFYDDYDTLRPGIKMETGYQGITVSVSDANVIQASMGTGSNSQFLRISALNTGSSEITLHHDMIETDAKLLVAVYQGEVPQGSGGFVFYVSQKHYLIDKNESKDIEVQVTGALQDAQGKLYWNNQNPELFALNYTDKTKAQITGIQGGSGRITLSDNAGNTETIYVSVSQGEQSNNVSVATESIIILSLEENTSGYLTKIMVNGNNQAGALWVSGNTDMLDLMQSGASCMLYPKETGITDVTVSGNGFAKTIVVKIVETEKEKMQASVINIDQRSFRLKKGETVILNTYYKVIKPSYEMHVVTPFDNKVIQWEKSAKSITVTAKNIGIQHLNISNIGCENVIDLMFEVDESLTGTVSEYEKLVYMVTDNPVIILEPGYVDYYTELKIIGEYTGSLNDFIWSSDDSRIVLNACGQYAFISVKKGEYKGTITVKNEYCAEKLTINVIVGSKYTLEETSEPYMYTEKSVYTMNKSDYTLLIPLEIRNTENVDYNNVQLYSSSYAVRASFANKTIIVNAVDTGSASVEIQYNSLKTKIYVIVQEIPENGAVYLTTAQNYVIVNRNNTKPINVNLVNYEEADSSKITWKSENTNVAHVIGSGRAVQVLGISAGYTKLTVKHAKSFNELEIVIKVLPSGSDEDICYLTTTDNVIETYVSTNSRQIGITKVGGRSPAVEAAWTVDNPSIVSVMGQNNIAYITAKKEGIAKITVSDREAGALDIVVIVREAKPGDLFIFPNSPIVQISPGSNNGVLLVTMPGIDRSEEQNFKWQIYSQMPSDINVARNGGSVVSIYAMGTRCTVNGIYAGTARIRITHPKAAEAAYIVVQVTNFQSMQFGQKSVTIVKNEMAYVTLETPDYENFTDKVNITSDNPSVATVVGTHRVALVSAQGIPGKALITASVKGADLTASVEITVTEEPVYNEPEIITGQTMFVLSPREAPFYVNAGIIGFGIRENDSEELRWELNYTEEQKEQPMIKIYPENTASKGFVSAGKDILVEVQQYFGRVFTGVEYCTMTITHPATSRKRVLYFQIQEDSNAFTISKKNVFMETGEQAELSCNILNGSSKDYDEVVWEAKRDSADPSKDIVRIIGRGKSVRLLGMTDGQTVVTASYRGLNSQANYCTVTVKSLYYFNINFQNILAYPGQKDGDGKGMFCIGYSVRPPNTPIQWENTDFSNTPRVAQTTFGTAVDDGSGTGQGKIYFNFEREGSFILVGIANNKVSRVNVQCKNVFNFQLDSPGVRAEKPYREAEDNVYNDDGIAPLPATRIKDAGYAIPYKITPAEASIKLIPNTENEEFGYSGQQALLALGWDIIIGEPKTRGLSGYGYIYIKNRKEGTVNLKFRLIMPDGTEVSPSGEYDCCLMFTSWFPNGYSRLIPVFQRISGNNSNSVNISTGPIGSYPDKSIPVTTNPVNDGPYARVYMETGITGEYLTTTGVKNNFYINSETEGNRKPINDVYNIAIADGEQHYIILDKAHPDAVIKIMNYKTEEYEEDQFFNTNKRKLIAEREDLENGLTAIKVSGGNDFIAYTNFGNNFYVNFSVSVNRFHADNINYEKKIWLEPDDWSKPVYFYDTSIYYDKHTTNNPTRYTAKYDVLEPHMDRILTETLTSTSSITDVDYYLCANYEYVPAGSWVYCWNLQVIYDDIQAGRISSNDMFNSDGACQSYRGHTKETDKRWIKTNHITLVRKGTLYYKEKEDPYYSKNNVSYNWDILNNFDPPSGDLTVNRTYQNNKGYYTYLYKNQPVKNVKLEMERYQKLNNKIFEVNYIDGNTVYNPLYGEKWVYIANTADKAVTGDFPVYNGSRDNSLTKSLMDVSCDNKPYSIPAGQTGTAAFNKSASNTLYTSIGIKENNNSTWQTNMLFNNSFGDSKGSRYIEYKTKGSDLVTSRIYEFSDINTYLAVYGKLIQDIQNNENICLFTHDIANNNSTFNFYNVPESQKLKWETSTRSSLDVYGGYIYKEYFIVKDGEVITVSNPEYGRVYSNKRLAYYPFGEKVNNEKFYNYIDLQRKTRAIDYTDNEYFDEYIFYPIQTNVTSEIYNQLVQTITIQYKNQHSSINTLTINIYHKVFPKSALGDINRTFGDDSTTEVLLNTNNTANLYKMLNSNIIENRVLTDYEINRGRIRINKEY